MDFAERPSPPAGGFAAAHLINIDDFSDAEIRHVLDLAEYYAGFLTAGARPPQRLAGKTQINLFFEDSTRTNLSFELAGKKTALFFQRLDPEIVKALQESHGVRAVEVDLTNLSSRDLIDRVLTVLGEPGSYREHRFAAANGAAKDRLTVTAWGFHLPRRSLFVTDRQIPAGLHRFFFEKGLEIVYFQ